MIIFHLMFFPSLHCLIWELLLPFRHQFPQSINLVPLIFYHLSHSELRNMSFLINFINDINIRLSHFLIRWLNKIPTDWWLSSDHTTTSRHMEFAVSARTKNGDGTVSLHVHDLVNYEFSWCYNKLFHGFFVKDEGICTNFFENFLLVAIEIPLVSHWAILY